MTTQIAYVRDLFQGNDYKTINAAEFINMIQTFPAYEYTGSDTNITNLYFDIDNEDDTLDAADLQCIQDDWEGKLLQIFPEAKIAIGTSHGTKADGKRKNSWRFWIPNIRARKCDIDYLVKQINAQLRRECDTIPLLDEGVYDPNRKMRCVGTSKSGENRPLKLVKGELSDTLITLENEGAITLPEVEAATPKPQSLSIAQAVPNMASMGQKETRLRRFIDAGLIDHTCDERNTWLTVSWAIKKEFGDTALAHELFEMYSKRSRKFDAFENDKIWYSLKPRDVKQADFAHIYTQAKIGNAELYTQIIDETRAKQSDDETEQTPLQIMAQEFEKTHCKILSTGSYINTASGLPVVMAKNTLVAAYEHLVYYPTPKKPENFINAWIKNNPSIRSYDDVGVYPHDTVCPPNIFNLWIPFEMETMTEYTPVPDAIDSLLHLMRVLCDNNETLFQYFVNWTANLIQFPSQKSTCPVFVAEEGIGKGTFVRFLEGMLGTHKVLATSNPSEHVWGHFNGGMQDSYIVDIEELSKKDSKNATGRIKELITEPNIVINNKGVKPFTIKSFHKFIMNSNESNPIETSNGDRRKFIVRCSDELKHNTAFWDKMRGFLNDKNAIKTCYNYFRTLPDVPLCFLNIPIPCTDYHNELKSVYEAPHKRFLDLYIIRLLRENNGTGIIKKPIGVIYDAYKDWIIKHEIVDYEIKSAVSFGCKMTFLKMDGLGNVRTKTGMIREFNLDTLAGKYIWKTSEEENEENDED